ncbi:MAG: hypothetical protein WB984_05090 [Thermoplasmata archaeon]
MEGMFRHPTSVLLFGESRPLLSWVAYAFASAENPMFLWTDVRLAGQPNSPEGPLARNLVPEDRLHVLETHDLLRNDEISNKAIANVIRGDEAPDNVQLLIEFLRLPPRLQELLSSAKAANRPATLVLSNAHRMAAHYPAATVGPVIRAIVATDTILFMTFADVPGTGQNAFETVLRLEGRDPREWRQAALVTEKGPSDGPFRTGSMHRLSELEPIATVLARDLK